MIESSPDSFHVGATVSVQAAWDYAKYCAASLGVEIGKDMYEQDSIC